MRKLNMEDKKRRLHIATCILSGINANPANAQFNPAQLVDRTLEQTDELLKRLDQESAEDVTKECDCTIRIEK